MRFWEFRVQNEIQNRPTIPVTSLFSSSLLSPLARASKKRKERKKGEENKKGGFGYLGSIPISFQNFGAL